MFACCTAYGISRFKFRGSNALYYVFLLGMIIPAQLTILPQVLLEKSLGLMIGLLRLSSLPLMKPLRKSMLELVETVAT